jgi:RhoGAP domain
LQLESDFDNFDWDGCDVHVLAGLVKNYFRELPEPIFPFSQHDRFLYNVVESPVERVSVSLEFNKIVVEGKG